MNFLEKEIDKGYKSLPQLNFFWRRRRKKRTEYKHVSNELLKKKTYSSKKE